jgi:hypothetical protein
MVVGVLERKKGDIFSTGYFGCRDPAISEFRANSQFRPYIEPFQEINSLFSPKNILQFLFLHLMIGAPRAV